MSGRDRIIKPPDCGRDAAAYMLDALSPDEARAFARHLEFCAVCRDEVSSLAPVIDALPSSAPPRRIRPAFRRRMLRAVRAEPKASARASRGSLAPALALAAAVAVAVFVQVGGSPRHARVIPAAVGRAALHVTGSQGELIVAHLAPLPDDRIYELWLQSGTRTVPSTLFAVTARGRADLGVPGDLHGVSRLLVTVEPRGGSLTPTTPAVIQVPVSYVRRS